MEYMTQLNRFFEKVEEEDLPASAQIVYLHLLNINNRLHWCEWFKVANSRLENLTKLKSNNSIVSAKNRLKQANLLDFKSEGKVTTRYKIIPIPTAQDGAQDTAQDGAQDTAQVSAQDGAQLIRQRQRQKNIYTPEFEKIWSVYPRHDGKAEAQKAFDKLKPSEELITAMLSAIAKQTEKWRNDGGKFIPHCSTWLNQRRWEDEGIVLQETPALSAEEKAARDRQRAEEDAAFEAAERERLKKEYDIVYDEDGKLAV